MKRKKFFYYGLTSGEPFENKNFDIAITTAVYNEGIKRLKKFKEEKGKRYYVHIYAYGRYYLDKMKEQDKTILLTLKEIDDGILRYSTHIGKKEDIVKKEKELREKQKGIWTISFIVEENTTIYEDYDKKKYLKEKEDWSIPLKYAANPKREYWVSDLYGNLKKDETGNYYKKKFEDMTKEEKFNFIERPRFMSKVRSDEEIDKEMDEWAKELKEMFKADDVKFEDLTCDYIYAEFIVINPKKDVRKLVKRLPDGHVVFSP